MDIWSACEKCDLEKVRQLIQDGQDVNRGNSIETKPLMWAANYGHDQVVHELIRAGAEVNGKNNNKRTALQRASSCGHSSVVRTLAMAGANLNVQDKWGIIPLMRAVYSGRANVVVELIRAGANVSVVSSHEWESVAAGSTALHFAAKENSIECGVLLVEAGADMRARSNWPFQSPLDLASHDFRQAIQQAQSFYTKRIVAVIGNGEHGKSTLIAALQAEGNNLWKKFTNRFTKVQDIRKRTIGMESNQYGETLSYDFAGQSNYHGPHQSFLEGMLCKPGVSVSLLLLAKATDEEDVIIRQVTGRQAQGRGRELGALSCQRWRRRGTRLSLISSRRRGSTFI